MPREYEYAIRIPILELEKLYREKNKDNCYNELSMSQQVVDMRASVFLPSIFNSEQAEAVGKLFAQTIGRAMQDAAYRFGQRASEFLNGIQEEQKRLGFVELVVELLIAEYGKTREQAMAIVKTHTSIMVNAMMAGRGGEIRACAMALEMAEDNANSNATAMAEVRPMVPEPGNRDEKL